jgi:hypothetical protein
MYNVRMDLHRSTWNWFVTNPQGGGFGSNHCGAKREALARALRGVPVGAPYKVVTNGKEGLIQYKA